MIAAPRFLVSLLCLTGTAQGLSLVQSKAAWSSSVSTGHTFDDLPDTKEIEAILENINSSLEEVSEVVIAANGTAYKVVGGLLHSIATMQDSLAALSTAADAAAQVPGAADAAAQASSFIDKANSTLQKAQTQVPATLDKVSKKFASIVPELATLADKAITKYEDAVDMIVSDICNHTGQNLYKKLARQMQHWKKIHQKSEAKKKFEKLHKRALKAVGKSEALVLLEDRVHQNGNPVSTSNVDEAIWNKGGKKSPEARTTKEIEQANATLESLSDKIAEVNATIADLLATQLDAAFEALDKINATIAPHLADLPAVLAQPASSALDLLLSHRETLQQLVQDRLSEVTTGIQDALVGLDDEVVPLADMLQAAVDECSNASSTEESGATESNATTEASSSTEESGATESDATTEATAADDNGTATQ